MIWLLIGFAVISYGMIFYAEYRKEKRKKREEKANASHIPNNNENN